MNRGYAVVRSNKIFLFSLLFFSSLHATTIVLIRNQDAVYIGADSRIGDEHGNDLGTECKVMRIGDYYFTHAGLGIDAQYGFNIKEIARAVFSSNLSFDEKIENFIADVDRACTSYLKRIKSGRRDLYSRVVNGHINIETAIAGLDEPGTPFFQVIKFSAAGSDEDIKISMPVRYMCPGDCDGGQVVVMLGQMSNSEGAVDDWAYGMMRRPVRAINYLIKKEIEHNDRVGPPVTILKIDKNGHQWIQHSDDCVDE
jgi:hypothetical protein